MFEIIPLCVWIFFLFFLGLELTKVLWSWWIWTTLLLCLNYFYLQEVFPDFVEKSNTCVTYFICFLLRHTNFTKLHFEKCMDIFAWLFDARPIRIPVFKCLHLQVSAVKHVLLMKNSTYQKIFPFAVSANPVWVLIEINTEIWTFLRMQKKKII